LVAMNYFTKWTEEVPLKNMRHREVIEFVTEHIIHRFGIPQTLTTDQGSSSYYAQANGQAESSNKILIKLIKKKIEENSRR